MMNLWKEAQAIAQEAWEESEFDMDTAQYFIHQSCDGHEVAIYYHKAIRFCADQDTRDGEDWLEDCEGADLFGDSFGGRACRLAFATLYCAAMEALSELESSHEPA